MAKVKTVIIDIDDTILNFNEHTLSLLNNKKGTKYCLEHLIEWEHTITNREVYERFDFADDKNFYLNQPELEGAMLFIENLSKLKGLEIIIATALPTVFSEERKERVLSLFPGIKENNYILSAEYMIDDATHNFGKNIKKGFLINYPWNETTRHKMKCKKKIIVDQKNLIIDYNFIYDFIKNDLEKSFFKKVKDLLLFFL